MRNKLLAAVGSGFYYETFTILRYREIDIIWFRRDADGNLLLNVRMTAITGAPGLLIEDNDWIAHGALEDLECPPSGRLLRANYPSGDYLKIEFSTLDSPADLAQRFPHRPLGLEDFEAPLPTAYDYVLVDSRTGITEIGGLCVGPLADRLVVMDFGTKLAEGTLVWKRAWDHHWSRIVCETCRIPR